MDPLASVRLPIVDPVAALIVPVVVRFSLPKLMSPDESVMDPLASVRFPMVDPEEAFNVPTVAVPDTFAVPSTIKFSLMFIAVESSELRLVPLILIAPNITDPVPFGSKFMFSFDLVPSMLLSFILIAGKDTAPVPAGENTRSSFDLVADISLPLKLRSPPVSGDR